jgi:hypothetical protein
MSLFNQVISKTEQGIQDMLNYSSFKFKKRKTLGAFQLDEFEYRTVQAKNALIASDMVGPGWMLVSITKPKKDETGSN